MQITLIDKAEHFEANVANYKMFTDDCFEENAVKFERTIASYQASGSNVDFIQGKLVNVMEKTMKIEIELPNGEKQELAYDTLCIATGASYTSPWRAGEDKLATFAERQEECLKYRNDVEAASSILCIGGGATGVETAGYLKEMKKDKKVGLCQRN